jgi:hypothetical protein
VGTEPTDGTYAFRDYANAPKKQSWRADKRWTKSLGDGRGTKNASPQRTKYYTEPRTWTCFIEGPMHRKMGREIWHLECQAPVRIRTNGELL